MQETLMSVGHMHSGLQNAVFIKQFCDIPLKDTAHMIIKAFDWLSHFLSANHFFAAISLDGIYENCILWLGMWVIWA